MRSASRALPSLLLCLAIGGIGESLAAQDIYWENARPISEGKGRFPVALKVKDGLVALWQESEIVPGQSAAVMTSGAELGRAWISSARLEDGAWQVKRRFAGPYEYRGTEPTLFTAAVSEDDRIAIAVAVSGFAAGADSPVTAADKGGIEIILSEDGGRKFETAAQILPRIPAVAPRIFPSATGGWILFVAQGQGESLAIFNSTSPDGRLWSDFSPLMAESERFDLSFLPSAAPLSATTTDMVVFQSLSSGDRPTFQIYQKLSGDGGKTWSAAMILSSFPDPVNRERSAPVNWDNQRPQLGRVGGGLWVAWERSLRGGQAQVYMASFDEAGNLLPGTVDRVSPGTGTCANPQVLDIGGRPAAVWFDNRRGENRVFLAARRGADWPDMDLSGGNGSSSFGRAVAVGDRLYALWQNDASGADRIMLREPDTSTAPPLLSALDFTPGKRSRQEKASVRIDVPPDSSGIAGFSWIWTRDPKAEPPRNASAQAVQTRLTENATEDGDWYFAALAQDFAGNWSKVARLRFDRKRRPPPPPLVYPAEVDEAGFLLSNSFALSWTPPDEDDIAGYTWELRYAGPAETPLAIKASLKPPQAQAPLPGLTPYESALVQSAGPPLPPPTVLGREPRADWSNIDDGYYIFSVAVIDGTGNISDAASILVRANKYLPYTAVTFADAARDDFGRTSLRIMGRGYLAEGAVERVVVDRDGREPYDIVRSRAEGGFRIASDRQIDGFAFEEAEAGAYRIGIYHPKRGWYWTRPLLTVDISGTVKYGYDAPYEPSWRLLAPHAFRFSIYDAFVLTAILFSALGLVLSFGQALRAARDGVIVREQVLALINGGPMPSAEKERQARRYGKRRTYLIVKFTTTIASLVMFVVLLVSVPLGYYMLQTESASLAQGLAQRASVLLESVAQGARSYLPTQDTLQLGFLPQQARAMEDAAYITLTGYGTKNTEPDSVWATNDPDIAAKIDTPQVLAGGSKLKDQLSPDIGRIAAELNAQAAAEVGDINRTIADLNLEGRSLATKLDDASKRRFEEVAQSLATYQKMLNEKLFALASKAVGSTPAFDPKELELKPRRYIFFKPVLYRAAADQLYFRGMVRLEVSTERIVASVIGARVALVRITLIIAAVVLAVGIAGAFLLSINIVRPIRKLVLQIQKIRDAEDKEELAGSRIEVSSHDELLELADAVNQMTDGLVLAAKASKELIVGKGIQKMFIPLETRDRAKLSIGRRDEKDFEIFGYYEGAKGVSGDYWDFRSINSRYHYFIKCDISGKGVSAALIMVEVATMVINYFKGWQKTMPKNIDLTDIAYQINDFIEERGYEGKRFAAFTIGIWDSTEGKAFLCEAGDRKLHVWNALERRLVEELLPDAPAAGIFPSFMVQMKTPFVQVTRKLEKGDVLLLYTDGIEEAKRHFRDKDYAVIECTTVEKDAVHENHSGGQDGEEFGYDRLTAVLEALDSRGRYALEKHHAPNPDEKLSFDFSSCSGSLEEMIIALVSVEKVFRIYRDPKATEKDLVVIDHMVDDFLRKKRCFDQIRLFLGEDGKDGSNPNVLPNNDPENPGYVYYRKLREDDQYDDLTILGIRRK